MFGLNRSKAATQAAVQYCSVMVGGIDRLHDKKLPNQVFADAYVVGFFQKLIMVAIDEIWRGNGPDMKTMVLIAEKTFEQLAPGFGRRIVATIPAVNQPTHPAHIAYKVGQREGEEYVSALVANDQATMTARIRGFREFVVRNYLGAEYVG